MSTIKLNTDYTCLEHLADDVWSLQGNLFPLSSQSEHMHYYSHIRMFEEFYKCNKKIQQYTVPQRKTYLTIKPHLHGSGDLSDPQCVHCLFSQDQRTAQDVRIVQAALEPKI